MDEHFRRAQHALAPVVIGGVENVQQRYFERRLDLAAVELELEPGSPISSSVSRSAAANGPSSVLSRRPPGKLI
jgi:hypothetical protein